MGGRVVTGVELKSGSGEGCRGKMLGWEGTQWRTGRGCTYIVREARVGCIKKGN